MTTTRLLTAFALALAACGGGGSPDAPVIDSRLGDVDAAPVGLPSWMLEDVQPSSPRVGQTYGLQTFSNKIVVVTLLEGF